MGPGSFQHSLPLAGLSPRGLAPGSSEQWLLLPMLSAIAEEAFRSKITFYCI